MGVTSRRATAVLGIALVVLLPRATSATSHQVTVADNRFAPKTHTVAAGTTVTWQQTGNNDHTVTADDGRFDSHPACPPVCMQRDDRFQHRFDEPGTYPYYCKVHRETSHMEGTIVVQAAASTTTPTTGGGGSTGTSSPGSGQGAAAAQTGSSGSASSGPAAAGATPGATSSASASNAPLVRGVTASRAGSPGSDATTVTPATGLDDRFAEAGALLLMMAALLRAARRAPTKVLPHESIGSG